MNFSEFKKRLGAEPLADDADMRAARASGPEFEQAAEEAERFERKLEGALRIEADSDSLVAEIMNLASDKPRRGMRWLAIAASLAVAVGVGTLAVYRAGQPRSLEDYVAGHYRHEGDLLPEMAGGDFDRAEVNRLMARWDAVIRPELIGKIDFIKVCPTPGGQGAHLVFSSADGLVTVFFMPETRVDGERLIRFDEMQAEVFDLERGSIAIITRQDQSTAGLQALVRDNIDLNGS